jgi:hypothetical protein
MPAPNFPGTLADVSLTGRFFASTVITMRICLPGTSGKGGGAALSTPGKGNRLDFFLGRVGQRSLIPGDPPSCPGLHHIPGARCTRWHRSGCPSRSARACSQFPWHSGRLDLIHQLFATAMVKCGFSGLGFSGKGGEAAHGNAYDLLQGRTARGCNSDNLPCTISRPCPFPWCNVIGRPARSNVANQDLPATTRLGL